MRKSTTSATDLPLLRAARDAYRSLLDHCNSLRQSSDDIAELLAIAAVHDDLTRRFDGVGRKLTELERSPC